VIYTNFTKSDLVFVPHNEIFIYIFMFFFSLKYKCALQETNLEENRYLKNVIYILWFSKINILVLR